MWQVWTKFKICPDNFKCFHHIRNLIEIRKIISEIKHSDDQTEDETSPNAHFTHFVITLNKLQTDK